MMVGMRIDGRGVRGRGFMLVCGGGLCAGHQGNSSELAVLLTALADWGSASPSGLGGRSCPS